MLKNAKYIMDNIIIADEVNTTKQYCKAAQVGVDVTVRKIYSISEAGFVSTRKSYIPDYIEVPATEQEYLIYPETGDLLDTKHIKFKGWHLKPDTVYIAEINEGTQFGKNETGYFILRSSLNRCGISVVSAVFDPGYTCKDASGKVLPVTLKLVVHNKHGFYLEQNARIAQLIVADNEDTNLYSGQYQNGITKSNIKD